ncbi:hypothetical protein CEXT_607901 [Caerostris extrusa]|uniref:Uncharacterized protein n=1 Tax=Caerostris extrusa TaxID=172846 RepID=A0AAV4MZQ2_CAEEX|nr:hypothetical protein CEXT_607901 [Caerostris extrusa]
MLLLTDSKLIKAIIKEIALNLYEKLIRTGNLYWINYPTITRNLKTQKGFAQFVLDDFAVEAVTDARAFFNLPPVLLRLCVHPVLHISGDSVNQIFFNKIRDHCHDEAEAQLSV